MISSLNMEILVFISRFFELNLCCLFSPRMHGLLLPRQKGKHILFKMTNHYNESSKANLSKIFL